MVENDMNRCNTNNSSSKFKSVQLLSVKSLLSQQQQQQQQDNENAPSQLDNNTYLIQAAAELLSRQWQRGGSTDDYYNKITVSGDSNCLPASYLLVGIKVDEVQTQVEETKNTNTNSSNNDDNNQQQLVLFGHGRLIECYESLAGRSAAVTYVVIHELYRKQQYGNILMTLLEQQIIQLGYHYMYLWTQSAILFYIKLGYSTTHRVSLYKSCLKPLQTEQVTLLEDMLRSKLQLSFLRPKQQQEEKGNENQNVNESKNSRLDDTQSQKLYTVNKNNILSSNEKIKRTETIMLLPSNDNVGDNVSLSTATTTTKNDDVWLRKRLVEQINIDTIIPIEERIMELKNGIECYLNRLQKNEKNKHVLSNNNNNNVVWKYFLVNVPWQQQVGPSCGLAALRMIRDYYYFYCDENITNVYGTSTGSSSSNCITTTDSYGNVHLQENDNNTINNNIIKFSSLLTVAKDLGYTDDGEIFDATNLVRLVSNNGSDDEEENETTTTTTNDCCGDFISCEMKSFQSITPLDVLQCLLSSSSSKPTTPTTKPTAPTTTKENTNDYTYTDGLYIIPYDTHKITKLPCCNTGLSAHYGIIVGIVFCPDNNNNKSNKNTHSIPSNIVDDNDNNDNVIVLEQIDTTTATNGLLNINNTNDSVLLLVQHGLSPKLSIASWNEFFISNQQLVSYDTSKYNMVTKLDLQDRILQFYHRRIKTNVIVS